MKTFIKSLVVVSVLAFSFGAFAAETGQKDEKRGSRVDCTGISGGEKSANSNVRSGEEAQSDASADTARDKK